jgi:hypothetical protein
MRIIVALGTNTNDERKNALYATYKRTSVMSTFARHIFVTGPAATPHTCGYVGGSHPQRGIGLVIRSKCLTLYDLGRNVAHRTIPSPCLPQ